MTEKMANRLVQLRKAHGYSQEELAEKLGLSRQAVSKWERAEASPDTDNLILLSKLYGIAIDEMLDAQPAEIERQPQSEPLTQPREQTERGSRRMRILKRLPVPVIVTIVFLLLGFLKGAWHPAWVLFLALPVFDSAISAYERRDPSEFAYPVFVAFVYISMGVVWGLWHPGWIIFLTIPVFYAIFPDREDRKEENPGGGEWV